MKLLFPIILKLFDRWRYIVQGQEKRCGYVKAEVKTEAFNLYSFITEVVLFTIPTLVHFPVIFPLLQCWFKAVAVQWWLPSTSRSFSSARAVSEEQVIFLNSFKKGSFKVSKKTKGFQDSEADRIFLFDLTFTFWVSESLSTNLLWRLSDPHCPDSLPEMTCRPNNLLLQWSDW